MEKKVDYIRVYGKDCYGCINHPGSVVMLTYYQDKEEFKAFMEKKLLAEGIPLHNLEHLMVPAIHLFLTKEQAKTLLRELQHAVAE